MIRKSKKTVGVQNLVDMLGIHITESQLLIDMDNLYMIEDSMERDCLASEDRNILLQHTNLTMIDMLNPTIKNNSQIITLILMTTMFILH